MLETSADLLKVVLATSIGVFTLFLCWGLFYLIMAVRNILVITKEARNVFDKVDSLLEAAKDKIHSSTSYLMLIGEAVKKILVFMKATDGKFSFPSFKKKKKEKPSSKGETKREEKSEEDDEKEDNEETW